MHFYYATVDECITFQQISNLDSTVVKEYPSQLLSLQDLISILFFRELSNRSESVAVQSQLTS